VGRRAAARKCSTPLSFELRRSTVLADSAYLQSRYPQLASLAFGVAFDEALYQASGDSSRLYHVATWRRHQLGLPCFLERVRNSMIPKGFKKWRFFSVRNGYLAIQFPPRSKERGKSDHTMYATRSIGRRRLRSQTANRPAVRRATWIADDGET